MDTQDRRQGRTSRREAPAPDGRVARSWVVRGVWFGAGWRAVVVGGIGVVVPGLPTTGFMIIAAACFTPPAILATQVDPT